MGGARPVVHGWIRHKGHVAPRTVIITTKKPLCLTQGDADALLQFVFLYFTVLLIVAGLFGCAFKSGGDLTVAVRKFAAAPAITE